MKKLLAALAALCVVSAALAVTGNPPTPSNGPGLVDGAWLNGIAGGQNESYQYGISAAGSSSHANSTQLPAGIALIEIDTVTANSGVSLPPAIAGTEISIFNSTSTTLTVYPSIANNQVTGAQDTINGGSSFSATGASGGAVSFFMCAKNGVWGAK
jgi:hypothetical protein